MGPVSRSQLQPHGIEMSFNGAKCDPVFLGHLFRGIAEAPERRLAGSYHASQLSAAARRSSLASRGYAGIQFEKPLYGPVAEHLQKAFSAIGS